MRLFLVMLDDLILKLFTAFSHWFQRLTGRTNFFLAKIAALIFAAYVAVAIGNYFVPVLSYHKTGEFELLVQALFSFVILKWVIRCDTAETHALEANKSKYPIDEIVHERWFRVLAVFFDLPFLFFKPLILIEIITSNRGGWYFEVIDILGGTAFPIFLYLANVDPLRPHKSKVRVWLEAFQTGIKKLAPSKVGHNQINLRSDTHRTAFFLY